MADITAAMVKALRDKTQLPMMDCKKALVESNGDVEVAIQTLRETGKKFMGKREDRTTEEGLIAVYVGVNNEIGSMIELQCESAPVASNEDFIALANALAEQLATGPGATTADELWAQANLQDRKDDLQNRIREIFNLARLVRFESGTGGYVHHDGKSGVLLQVEGGTDETAKDISMHVAAMNPQALSISDLDQTLVEKERSTLVEAATAEGKPANIIEKMVEGRMRNFYAEKVLEEQAYIKDDKQTVGKYADASGMKIKAFTRWILGES